MKFCPTCHALASIEEFRTEKLVRYRCRRCDGYFPCNTAKVSERVLKSNHTAEYLNDVLHYEADPSLQRVPIPCSKCGNPEQIMINCPSQEQLQFTIFLYCKRPGCREKRALNVTPQDQGTREAAGSRQPRGNQREEGRE